MATGGIDDDSRSHRHTTTFFHIGIMRLQGKRCSTIAFTGMDTAVWSRGLKSPFKPSISALISLISGIDAENSTNIEIYGMEHHARPNAVCGTSFRPCKHHYRNAQFSFVLVFAGLNIQLLRSWLCFTPLSLLINRLLLLMLWNDLS